MGEHELREALRGEAQAKIRATWQAAEAEVAARRAEVAAEVATLCDESARRQAAVLAAERRTLLAAAELTARQRQLAAEAAIVKRLQTLARQLLPALYGKDHQQLWHTLAGELPCAEWQRVRVHPDDLEITRQRFPAAELSVEAALGGGLIAETADGRVVVDNSLTGRLERGWPGLLIPLMAAVYEEVDRDAAGPTATG